MTLLLGPFHVVLLVLLISGTDKVLRPGGAAGALKASGLVPGVQRLSLGRVLGRILGIAEISCAALAFLKPSLFSVLAVAVVFSGFIWFVHKLRNTDATAGCGCFGSSTTPPGLTHLVFNAIATAIALAAAGAIVLSQSRPEIQLVTAEGFGTLAAYVVAASVGAILFLNGPTLLADITVAKSGDHTHRPVKTFAVSKAFKP